LRPCTVPPCRHKRLTDFDPTRARPYPFCFQSFFACAEKKTPSFLFSLVACVPAAPLDRRGKVPDRFPQKPVFPLHRPQHVGPTASKMLPNLLPVKI